MIPLEDNAGDILGKAQRGLGLPGETDPVRLGLSPRALRELAHWHPVERTVTGLAIFASAYGDMMVNSYIVFDAKSRQAAAFDTGADCDEMMAFIKAHQLSVSAILLTHAHGDHIMDLPRLKKATGAPAYIGDQEDFDEAEKFPVGRSFAVGSLQIETRLTCGHTAGGITYIVRGLEHPVAVVGDAMFAGSMGGGMVSYRDALRTNREQILSLPDNTILCCGHGPLTTVGEEKVHNPFFALGSSVS
jgi:hydroxyacylglutathione hydrolase